jgi:hypothetical protein
MQPFARQTLAAQMKPTPKEEKQRKFDMLGELLRKAGVYTDFLKVRIEDARKNTDRHTRYLTCFVNSLFAPIMAQTPSAVDTSRMKTA